jgi:hypothetical protein
MNTDNFTNIIHFNWFAVALFYLAVVLTLLHLIGIIWGYRKDKEDIRRNIEFNQKLNAVYPELNDISLGPHTKLQ